MIEAFTCSGDSSPPSLLCSVNINMFWRVSLPEPPPDSWYEAGNRSALLQAATAGDSLLGQESELRQEVVASITTLVSTCQWTLLLSYLWHNYVSFIDITCLGSLQCYLRIWTVIITYSDQRSVISDVQLIRKTSFTEILGNFEYLLEFREQGTRKWKGCEVVFYYINSQSNVLFKLLIVNCVVD